MADTASAERDADSESCRTPTRSRSATEEDAWRARQMLASKRLLLNASSPVGSGSTYLDSAHVESNGGVVRDVLNRCRSSLGSAEGGSARNNLESSRAAFHSKGQSLEEKWPLPPAGAQGGEREGGITDEGYESGSERDKPRIATICSPQRKASRSGSDVRSVSWAEGASVGANGDALIRPSVMSRPGEGAAESEDVCLDGEVEEFGQMLREDFEHKLLVTARERMRAAVNKTKREGRARLIGQRTESLREIRRLEEEGNVLRAEIASLRGANTTLADKATVLGERLSALQLRKSRGSKVSRCLDAWQRCAAEARRERSKNQSATTHARRVLICRVLNAWRGETRRRLNSRGLRAADLKLEAISKEIISRYEAELACTRAALDSANHQIAVEKARQREMEEGMRRTLLRGMSAMNMEAMHILNDARETEPLGGSRSGGVSGGMLPSNRSVASLPSSRPSVAIRQRISEECPRPSIPPRPAAPASR